MTNQEDISESATELTALMADAYKALKGIQDEGMDKMYTWFEIAMFEVELDSVIRSKILDRIEKLRNEK